MIAHNKTFVIPVVEHWLEWEIAQQVCEEQLIWWSSVPLSHVHICIHFSKKLLNTDTMTLHILLRGNTASGSHKIIYVSLILHQLNIWTTELFYTPPGKLWHIRMFISVGLNPLDTGHTISNFMRNTFWVLCPEVMGTHWQIVLGSMKISNGNWYLIP